MQRPSAKVLRGEHKGRQVVLDRLDARAAAAAAESAACPLCGDTRGACRDVPAGFYCQAEGLQGFANGDGYLVPAPDPVSAAIAADPDIAAAHAAVEQAAARREKAEDIWRDAIRNVAAYELKSSEWVFGRDGQPIPQGDPKELRRLRLIAEDRLDDIRSCEEAESAARVAVVTATEVVRHRHTGQWTLPWPHPDSTKRVAPEMT